MASRSLNKVMLIGNLTRDPELRYTPQGTAVCQFGLATNRDWMTSSGERKEEVQFHRVIAWSKLAELCSQLLSKGSKVFVDGRIVYRSFEGKDGLQRNITEVVMDNMIVLSSKRITRTTDEKSTDSVGADGKEDIPVKQVEEEPQKQEKQEDAKAKKINKKETSKKDKEDKKAKKNEPEVEETVSDEEIPF